MEEWEGDSWSQEETGGEGEDWVWEDDMPIPTYQAWWFDLTEQG